MKFGEALEAVKVGKRISRSGWNGKEQYIVYAKEPFFIQNNKMIKTSPALVFVGTHTTQLGWLASQADMLAEDWIIKEESDEKLSKDDNEKEADISNNGYHIETPDTCKERLGVGHTFDIFQERQNIEFFAKSAGRI